MHETCCDRNRRYIDFTVSLPVDAIVDQIRAYARKKGVVPKVG